VWMVEVEAEVEWRCRLGETVDVCVDSLARSLTLSQPGRRQGATSSAETAGQSATGCGQTLARAHQTILQVQLCDVLA
jgi:hypothetical protein